MLTLIAYDVTDAKRLHKVAKVCEDWGVRVQYSVFECRLEADTFDRFWEELR
ncbi:MAG: CRISPR-associated endonuclease Cas2, partial [Verrucomicrobia bacterium]|nr:CRISPR-associated endonuclease Cas2 [Verrucomicrobiota bacterium]